MVSIPAKISLNNLSFEEIKIGYQFSFERVVNQDLVESFADLVWDYNPLHLDADYAKNTKFGRPIMHGMLLGGFFSALVGMICPGQQCVYISQSLNFKNPLYPNPSAQVIIMGQVVSKSESTKMLTINTVIKNSDGTIIVEGIALVKVGHK